MFLIYLSERRKTKLCHNKMQQDFFVSFVHLQRRWEGGSEVLHQSILLLRPVEREDAAGHRGQEEGEAETEGMSEQSQAQGPGSVHYIVLFYVQQSRNVLILWLLHEIEVLAMSSGAEST